MSQEGSRSRHETRTKPRAIVGEEGEKIPLEYILPEREGVRQPTTDDREFEMLAREFDEFQLRRSLENGGDPYADYYHPTYNPREPQEIDLDYYRYDRLMYNDFDPYELENDETEFFYYQMMVANEKARNSERAILAPVTKRQPTPVIEEKPKSRICRHFLRGHCKFGDKCNFFHGAPLVHASDQLVFIGGLPTGLI